MSLRPIDQLYRTQCELIEQINGADERTPHAELLRWARELAKIDQQIDLRMRAGEVPPSAWDLRTRASVRVPPAGR